MLGTLFALLVFALGLPVLWKIVTTFMTSRWLDAFLLLPSSSYAFMRYASGARDYWVSMLTMASLGVGFIAVSSWLLPRISREAGRSRQTDRWAQRIHSWRFARLSRRSGAGSLAPNPCAWLAGRDRFPRLVVWSAALAILGLGWWAYLKLPMNWLNGVLCGLLGIHLLLKFAVAMEACRRLNTDQRSGAFELLLTTRLNIADILTGHMSALVKLFWPSIVAVILLNLLWMAWLNEVKSDPVLPWILLGGIGILPLDIRSLVWVGSALSLRGHGYHRTVFATLGRVLIPPWVAMLVLFLLVFGDDLLIFGSSMPLKTVPALFLAWIVMAATCDGLLAVWARGEIVCETRAPRHVLSSQVEPLTTYRMPALYQKSPIAAELKVVIKSSA